MKWYLTCGLALVGLAVFVVTSESQPPEPGGPESSERGGPPGPPSRFQPGQVLSPSEGTKTVTFKGKTIDAVTTFEGSPTSYNRRGKDKFSVGYFVKDGTIIKKNSLLADRDAPADTLDLGDFVASGEGINAVIATGKGTALTLTGSINVSDNGDGKHASDFSGLGVQILASDRAKVDVNSMRIDTKGFLRAALISDNRAQVRVKDTTVTALGANPLTQAYKGYVNSADQNIMLSPPWVLGIQGGIRAGNMLGDRSTLTLIGSKISSGGWAILSTDACTNPVMNVVDCTLEILPESKGGMSSGKFSYSSKYGSGYGTYFIGNARENFYGVTFKGLTYAGIYKGGEGTYRSSKGTIELKDAEGKALEPVAGKGKPTVIDAVWGFMNHGDATVNVLDGTVVNAEEAVFLSKAGGATFTVDNAVLNPASGIILQMMDNDDRTVGGSMRAFNTEFKEAAGWPSESGNVTKKGAASAGGPGGPPGGGPGPASGAPGPNQGPRGFGRQPGRSAPAPRVESGVPSTLDSSPGVPPEGRPGDAPEGPPGPPPGGFGPGGPGGPPESGQIMPRFMQEQLNLTDAQKKELDELQKEVDAGIAKVLTPEQMKQLKEMRPGPNGPPPGGPGGPEGPGGRGGSSAVKLLLTNGSYKGNVFNGSGYYRQSGRPLEVTIGEAATLDGAISLTETRHINEAGKQNTHFTINEYYYLGHVANRNYRNGASSVEVSLKDGGKWVVAGESLISKLVIDNGTIEGADGAKVLLKIDGKEVPIKSGQTYSGNIVISLVKERLAKILTHERQKQLADLRSFRSPEHIPGRS